METQNENKLKLPSFTERLWWCSWSHNTPPGVITAESSQRNLSGRSGLLNGQANAAGGRCSQWTCRDVSRRGAAPASSDVDVDVLGSFHTSGEKTLDCVQQLDEGMKPRLSGANLFPRARVISLYALAGTRGSDLRSRLNWTIWKEGSEERFCCIWEPNCRPSH